MREQIPPPPLVQRLSRYASALNEAMKASEALIAPEQAPLPQTDMRRVGREQARTLPE